MVNLLTPFQKEILIDVGEYDNVVLGADGGQDDGRISVGVWMPVCSMMGELSGATGMR